MGLSLEQQFVKTEATADDVLMVLSTLWKCSSTIRFMPRTRVAFHCAVLLCAIGGFRMNVVMGLKYRQLELAFVRMNGAVRLVGTVTLRQNKRKKAAIRRTQDEM